MLYDFIVVGAGLFGACFAYKAKQMGKKVLVLERRNHLGGNLYCENMEGINVHKYGAHIFHTSNKRTWNFVNSLVEFNRYTNSPMAFYKGELYNLPFNMNTFHSLWGVRTPQEAFEKIEEQKKGHQYACPQNLEEQALSLVGTDIYEKLIKGYTEKQWGRPCCELPAFIIKRLPLRFTFDNNYFNDTYQGIPVGGYNRLIEKLLDGIETRCGVDYLLKKNDFDAMAEQIVYTGPIDAFFNYDLGTLEYRSLHFEEKVMETPNFQGNAVVNYTEKEIPYTRIIEHKHFEFGKQAHSVVSYEYPKEWKKGDEAYYPINNEKNNQLYERYKARTLDSGKFIFGGRLATYKYYDMHQIVAQVLDWWDKK